jgi:dTDP-4-dehydrorhamnose 3,5-epimerase
LSSTVAGMAASSPDSSGTPKLSTTAPGPMADVVMSDVIAGVVIVEPKVFPDERGRFIESYRRSWFPDGREMVQANRSDKRAGSLVGLHYHLHQADYWYVPVGRALVVLHDLREGSPTEGATLTMEIGEREERGVYIPPGVAHGFAAISDLTITYLVDQYYSPDDELGVAWDDPEIGADWGISDPVVSKRDQTNPRRSDLPTGLRPLMGGVAP